MYPFLSLRDAISRVQTLWQHEKRNPAPIPVAASHWDYAAKSSGAFQTISALKQFGLLNDEGSGDKRQVRLSEPALAILREEQGSEEWLSQIRAAALRPPIHRELWDRFKTEASDKNLQTYLVFDRKFAEFGATTLIKLYRDTINFARLAESDNINGYDDGPTLDDPTPMTSTPTFDPPPMAKPAGTSVVREFAVPLPSGAIAAFKIPFPMSEEDFAQYSTLLTAYKAAIVTRKTE